MLKESSTSNIFVIANNRELSSQIHMNCTYTLLLIRTMLQEHGPLKTDGKLRTNKEQAEAEILL